jgi:DNA-binding SARP family transcriptional activator
MHTPSTAFPDLPRLEVLGAFRWHNAQEVQAIKGRKRQALLACLLEARIAGREEVSKTELIDSLLNDVPEPQGLNALRIEVHDLRTLFHRDVIETSPTGYRLGPISSDAELFLATHETQWWRAAYLEGSSFNRNDEVGYQRLLETLHACALEQLESNPIEAVRVMRILIQMEPFDLEYLRSKLHALRVTHNHRAVRLAYHKARTRLREVGEHLPEAWDVFLDGA